MYELWELVQLSEGEEPIPMILIEKSDDISFILKESIKQNTIGKSVVMTYSDGEKIIII
jgi:hypothetical protein